MVGHFAEIVIGKRILGERIRAQFSVTVTRSSSTGDESKRFDSLAGHSSLKRRMYGVTWYIAKVTDMQGDASIEFFPISEKEVKLCLAQGVRELCTKRQTFTGSTPLATSAETLKM